MEPIAALSVVSNVIQVIDFSARIISKSSELYKSSNGQLTQHKDIVTTSSDLERLTSKLAESIVPPATTTVLAEDELALHVLCEGCIEVSRQLQIGFNKLKVDGASSKWKSLRKALRSIWSKERIAELQSRLATYRDQLNSRILVGIGSKVDLIELRQSEGFAQLEEDVKVVIEAVFSSSAQIELKFEERAAVTCATVESNIQSAQSTIVDTVDRASRSQLYATQSVELQLTAIQNSSSQNVIATEESRDEIIASIASSAAVGSEEHERMTLQLKSAEEQIAALRKEIEQTNANIATLAKQLASNGAKISNKKQQKLIKETNLLYKLLVARDLMLQKLLELVENIKKRLFNLTISAHYIGWKLRPYEFHNDDTKLSKGRTPTNRAKQEAAVKAIFEAIRTGDADKLQALDDLQLTVNSLKAVRTPFISADAGIARFYKLVLPTIGSIEHNILRSEMSIEFTMAPLTWTIFATTAEANTRCKILDILLSNGANLHARDSTGLCAYDHARILRLDEETINKLNPFEPSKRAQIGGYGLLDAIRCADAAGVTQCLTATEPPMRYFKLDQRNFSPIALAISVGLVEVVPELLEHGFSPFAWYETGDRSCEPMACYLVRDECTEFQHELLFYITEWISRTALQKTGGLNLLRQTLEIVYGDDSAARNLSFSLADDNMRTNPWTLRLGDGIAFCVLNGEAKYVRNCLRHRRTVVSNTAWALYAAIRMGSTIMVELLLQYVDLSQPLSSHHCLASWWPYPCQCEEAVHSMAGHTFAEYFHSLKTSRLCPDCEYRRDRYHELSQRLAQEVLTRQARQSSLIRQDFLELINET